jgi:hypothetical protein
MTLTPLFSLFLQVSETWTLGLVAKKYYGRFRVIAENIWA